MMTIDKKSHNRIVYSMRQIFTWSEFYQNHFTKGRTNICADCGLLFIKAEMELDHYPEPVTPIDKHTFELSIEEVYNRIWNLPVRKLCKDCHKQHSASQNFDRKAAMRKRKQQEKSDVNKTRKA